MGGSQINPSEGGVETGSSRSAGGFYGQLKAKALSQCGETMRGCKSLRSLRSSQGALLEQLSSGLGGPAECRSLLYIHSTFKNPPRTSLANQGVCWVKGEEVCLRGTLEPLQLPCNLKQKGRRLEWQVERCHKGRNAQSGQGLAEARTERCWAIEAPGR